MRFTEQTVYLVGMAPAFLAGLTWGEYERRTSTSQQDRDALLMPAIIGLAAAFLWQIIVGALLLAGLGLGARAIIGRAIVWWMQPREPGCPAHPHIDRPIIRPEWADCCAPDCWTRIPQRDLRRR